MAQRLFVLAIVSACSTPYAPTPVDRTAGTAAPGLLPSTSVALIPSTTNSAAPVPSTAASIDIARDTASPAATSAVSAVEVKVTQIGLHVGGGPNDATTKAPIRRSVEPHFGAFRDCYGQLEERRGGDFGVDLRIPRDGGRAAVSRPRTALKGKIFEACMVSAFEAIDFARPKGNADVVVSYSVRFSP